MGSTVPPDARVIVKEVNPALIARAEENAREMNERATESERKRRKAAPPPFSPAGLPIRARTTTRPKFLGRLTLAGDTLEIYIGE